MLCVAPQFPHAHCEYLEMWLSFMHCSCIPQPYRTHLVLEGFFRGMILNNHVICQQELFSSLLMCMFLFFFYPIQLTKTSITVFNSCGENRHLCLVLTHRGKHSSFSTKYEMSYKVSRGISPLFLFAESFVMNGCWNFSKCFFCNDTIIWIFFSLAC